MPAVEHVLACNLETDPGPGTLARQRARAVILGCELARDERRAHVEYRKVRDGRERVLRERSVRGGGVDLLDVLDVARATEKVKRGARLEHESDAEVARGERGDGRRDGAVRRRLIGQDGEARSLPRDLLERELRGFARHEGRRCSEVSVRDRQARQSFGAEVSDDDG